MYAKALASDFGLTLPVDKLFNFYSKMLQHVNVSVRNEGGKAPETRDRPDLLLPVTLVVDMTLLRDSAPNPFNE